MHSVRAADERQIVKFDVEKNLIEPWEEMQKQIHPFLRGESPRPERHRDRFHNPCLRADVVYRIRRDHSVNLVSRLTRRPARGVS